MWEHDGDAVDVPNQLAAELLATPGGDFKVAEAAAEPAGDAAPADVPAPAEPPAAPEAPVVPPVAAPPEAPAPEAPATG
jgi:hypothetical protein